MLRTVCSLRRAASPGSRPGQAFETLRMRASRVWLEPPMTADLAAARALLSPLAVRARAREMLAHGLAGRLTAFTVDMDRLPVAADLVVETIRRNYPSLAIPFHARWRHFVAEGRDVWAPLAATIPDVAERARAAFDLAIVSVLLDAGAGMAWRYRDPATGLVSSRSEGLALASLRMFAAGAFSAHDAKPLRADTARLQSLTARDIAAGFQVSGDNPLVGVEGRAALLNALGAAVAALPGARPGGLFDLLVGDTRPERLMVRPSNHAAQPFPDTPRSIPRITSGAGFRVPQDEGAGTAARGLPAPAILAAVLEHLGPIWPSRITLAGVPLGDTWRHPLIVGDDPATSGLVPFHKLSQWLSYSLIEPLEAAGITVTDIDGLTGLPEYRNGGLFVDTGVLVLRDAESAGAANTVDSPLVVEWRALTVALLDAIAPLVRGQLGLAEADFPLARVLEGGTWAAGRVIAARLRADGGPPIRVVSDGTVF